MPYAEDYDQAATTLDAAAQVTAVLVDPIRTTLGSGVLVGGQLSDQVSDEVTAAGSLLDQITTELTQLAATCRERAETCRQAAAAQQVYQGAYSGYRADLRDWQDAGGAGTAPQPPPPPATPPPWANH